MPNDQTPTMTALAPCTHCFGRDPRKRCLGCGADMSREWEDSPYHGFDEDEGDE